METPEPPREGTATRLGKSAETHGLAAARRVGRGDEAQGLSILGLGASGGAFVCLFLPWVEFSGNERWGSPLPQGFSVFAYGAWFGLALAILLILIAALRLAALWRQSP